MASAVITRPFPPIVNATPERFLGVSFDTLRVFLDSCASTQEEAWRWPGAVPSDGLLVVARKQTQGRGRRPGRSWQSPAGGVYLSWRCQLENPAGLTLLGALAVARMLQEYGLRPWLKWPNDCWLGRQKVAGVLADCRWQGARAECVLGVGVNVGVHPPDEGTSMSRELGKELPLEAVTETLIASLLCLWRKHQAEGLAGYLDEVRMLSLPMGAEVEYLQSGQWRRARVEGLDSEGFLRLNTGETLAAVDSLRVLSRW